MAEKEENELSKPAAIAITIFVLVWVLLGLSAFITSLVCIGKSGSGTSKALGVIISWIFGPFYFIYLAFNKGYCRSNPNK